ncbi:IS200/IS605 family transposase [Zoogloea sp.]|uniref:IS200/IS605 family transposase n=1 Tax=Zoogloea sp. TaxID=49181 RepID=UPI001416826A|nr:MAG: IS200/IS605 family transposase [Zoogloea sp.]
MQHYRKTSHSLYDLKVHLVWTTKYRRPVLIGIVAERTRELIREICKSKEIEILKGHISKDHIHLFVSIPPYQSVSEVLQSIKGKTPRKLLQEFKPLSKQYWGQHLWARGYFAASSGNVTDEVILEYIKNQDVTETTDSDFSISGET